MKFSIVIPVYNVEKYIDKCLDSILKQSYDNFEVIIVNDGSPDNSQDIIDKYVEKDQRFKSYKKKNGGLSDARNYGLKYVTGDYLLFVDSDDYIEKDLLLRLNKVLKANSYDLIKFKINIVDDSGNLIRKERGIDNSCIVSVCDIFREEFCEPAWTYCYNKDFWMKNDFKYVKGKIHEDFGLTPQVIMMAKDIYYLNYYGYNYVQRSNSIMSSHSREKDRKKAYDMLEQFDRLINVKYDNNSNIDVYNSFLVNSLISKAKTLNGIDKKEYLKELSKRKVFDLLLTDTFSRKVKKYMLKLLYRS